MAKFARQLADGNPSLGCKIEVVNGKVEEVQIPEKVLFILTWIGWDFGGRPMVL